MNNYPEDIFILTKEGKLIDKFYYITEDDADHCMYTVYNHEELEDMEVTKLERIYDPEGEDKNWLLTHLLVELNKRMKTFPKKDLEEVLYNDELDRDELINNLKTLVTKLEDL